MNANDKNASAADLAYFNGDHTKTKEHMITDDLYMSVCGNNMTVFNPHLAGKRGKKVDVLRTNLPRNSHSVLRLEVIRAILDMTTIDEMVAYFKKMEDLHAGKNGVDLYAFYAGVTSKRGIDVESPFESEKIFQNEKMYFRISTTEFTLRDRTDLYNEPTIINTSSTSKSSIAKLYKKIVANPSLVEGKSFRDVSNLIQAEGVRSHFYCAVD